MGEEIKIDRKGQALEILDRLDEMRKDERRFDFKIKVDGKAILAQRDIRKLRLFQSDVVT